MTYETLKKAKEIEAEIDLISEQIKLVENGKDNIGWEVGLNNFKLIHFLSADFRQGLKAQILSHLQYKKENLQRQFDEI